MFRKTSVILALCVMSAAGVASATTIDLTTVDSTSTTTCVGPCTSADGVLFVADWADEASTGTGVISSFVRVQDNDTELTSEQGYNTSLGTPLDDKGGVDTHALMFSDLTSVTLVDGQQYYQFLLDIGQDLGHEDQLLSLNQIQIFQSTTDQLHDSVSGPSSPLIDFGADATEVFRLSDFSTTTWEILMDASLNSGNGSGDMFLYVRASAFAPDFGNDGQDDYVILYSQFGSPAGSAGTNDGPEEWALFGVPGGTPCLSVSCNDPQDPPSPAPEPASLLLLGTGLGMVAQRVRRKKSAQRKS